LDVQDGFVCELLDETAIIHNFDVDPGGKFMFPVAYINCIIHRMGNLISFGVGQVVKQLETYSGQSETGKDWECIVLLALLLRCFHATRYSNDFFDRVPLNCPQLVKFVLLPSACTSLDGARHVLAEQAESGTLCVTIAYPMAAKFPNFDATLLVLGGGRNMYVGLQMKLGNVYPVGGSQFPSDAN
jgi:hypothetical protein